MRWFACLQCAEILEDVPCFLIGNPNMTKEVKQTDNIYTEISSLLSEKKNWNENFRTTGVYGHITENYSKRPVRKSVLFACIYYVSIISQDYISYVHLINLMEIPYSNANRGMVFLASCIPRKARYEDIVMPKQQRQLANKCEEW